MRIAHPPTCFELHRNINSFLSVIPTIYKLSIEKQIYFAFQSKNTATYHDLRLDNFLYLKSQFAVDLNSKRYMIDYMILIELGNIIQPQSASSNKIIDCFFYQKHIIHHRLIQLPYTIYRLTLVLLYRQFVLRKPLQKSMTSTAIDRMLVYTLIANNIAGQRYPTFAVNPRTQISGIE
jgi:hypothetical protein